MHCGNWDALFDDVALTGTTTIDGRAVATVSVRSGELPAHTLYVDVATGDVVKAVVRSASGLGIPVTLEYGDYRLVGGKRRGVRLPHTVTTHHSLMGTTEAKVESVKIRR